MSSAQAVQFVTSWLAADESALTRFDAVALTALEGPPLLDADAAITRAHISTQRPSGASTVSVYLPQSRGFPAQFLAGVHFPSQDDFFFVFTRRASNTPWKAVYATPLVIPVSGSFQAMSAARPIRTDQAGHAEIVTSSTGLKVALSRVAQVEAAYASSSVAANHAGSSTLVDPLLADFVLARIAIDAATGATDTVTVESTAYPTYAYRTTDGGAVSFATLRTHIHWTAPGTTSVADPTILGYPPAIVPGLTPNTPYRTIDVNVLAMLSVAVPRKASTAPITAMGFDAAFLPGTGLTG
jgi:hypothetical protein